jgi:hypothetical protein
VTAAEARPYTRLARPYALTGGRTEPTDADLALEALVEMTWEGYDALVDLAFERREIIQLVHETLSVAEVAAHLSIPLGVARVLVSDLADDGFVVIHPPVEAGRGGSKDPNLLEKVLDGLRSL